MGECLENVKSHPDKNTPHTYVVLKRLALGLGREEFITAVRFCNHKY